MGQLIAGALTALGVVLVIIVLAILGTFFGGVAEWIVGLFFTVTIMTTLARFGVDVYRMSMWQLGATLGFISGFFKASGVKVNK